MVATLFRLRPGIAALPRNFRRLALCTSPAQLPELVPGLETSDSENVYSRTSQMALASNLFWDELRNLTQCPISNTSQQSIAGHFPFPTT
jgi:hypothetical protein